MEVGRRRSGLVSEPGYWIRTRSSSATTVSCCDRWSLICCRGLPLLRSPKGRGRRNESGVAGNLREVGSGLKEQLL
ncbi:unnamed protein product [Cuscuta campestris]|uniref:Uncharacterized protein n=1 Tax=Cuscuta campestris TaxID=132261 RepID=A0A484NF80_9ASTE|nr:unnamed protein product [Cuscuta campestris]